MADTIGEWLEFAPAFIMLRPDGIYANGGMDRTEIRRRGSTIWILLSHAWGLFETPSYIASSRTTGPHRRTRICWPD